MRNLLLLTQRVGTFGASDPSPLPPSVASTTTPPPWRSRRPFIQASALNSPAQVLYFITSDNVLYAYHLDTAKVLFTLPLSSPPLPQPSTSTSPPSPPPVPDDASSHSISPSDSILSLHYLSDTDSLLLTTPSGLLLSLSLSSLELSTLGSFPLGLLASSLSPDRELLSLLTPGYHLLLLTPDADVIADLPLPEAGEGPLPGQRLPLKGQEGQLETGPASITWRGDGQHFAVSTYHPSYDFRRLRVFSRMGEQVGGVVPLPLTGRGGRCGAVSPADLEAIG